MCQRLYIASRTALPSLGRTADGPYLTIAPLSSEAAAVRRWFSSDAEHFAEALASACGCGFPEFREDSATRAVSKDEEQTMRALSAYLEARSGRKYIAELLLCWVGDESDRPAHNREVELETLRAPGFRFRRAEVLRLRADRK